MMRWLFAIAITLVGCGGGVLPCQVPECAAPAIDLAFRVVDLAPAQLSCANILRCVNGCTTDPCIVSCEDQGSMPAVQAFEQLTICLTSACVSGAVDGGAAPCASLVDQSPSCKACLNEAQSGGFSTSDLGGGPDAALAPCAPDPNAAVCGKCGFALAQCQSS